MARPDLVLGTAGRCIYCGATEGLTTEHPIPLALGGGHVLLEASCPDCSRITSRLETTIARRNLLLYRTVLGLPTRHPKNRPLTFPGRIRRGDVWTDEDIPVDMIPGGALFPRLPVPGGWEGRPVAESVRVSGTVGLTAIRRSRRPQDVARLAGIDEVEVDLTLDPLAFMRLLAKIAWGFAVGWLGVDTLLPGIRGVILGTDPNIAGWVGEPPEGMRVFHEPTDQTFQVRVRNEGGGAILANLKLFAAQGTPEYFVIVGSRRWCDLVPLDPEASVAGGLAVTT